MKCFHWPELKYENKTKHRGDERVKYVFSCELDVGLEY